MVSYPKTPVLSSKVDPEWTWTGWLVIGLLIRFQFTLFYLIKDGIASNIEIFNELLIAI